MNKISVISPSYKPDIDLYFKEKVNLYVDFLAETKKGEINILWLCEPDVISRLKKNLHLYHHFYDYILTFDEEVLSKYKNSILHLQASNWITLKDYSNKKFSISMVVGNKMFAPGHVIRQKLWYKQSQIKNKNFYCGFFGAPEHDFDNPILQGGIKDPMFLSQFHIAIENCSIKNYFSEKIIDCFVSKTVPIYWGCKNIGDFFNTKGIITFESIDECITKCNEINENTYDLMLPYLEENYNLALQFKVGNDNIIKTINSLNIK